jgi:hypothetical protein
MRAAALLAVIGLAMSPLAVQSASASSERIVLGHASNVIQIAEGCGPGRHRVGGHRDHWGHWIPEHCVRN